MSKVTFIETKKEKKPITIPPVEEWPELIGYDFLGQIGYQYTTARKVLGAAGCKFLAQPHLVHKSAILALLGYVPPAKQATAEEIAAEMLRQLKSDGLLVKIV